MRRKSEAKQPAKEPQAAPPEAPQVAAPKVYAHRVSHTDSIRSIAAKYGATPSAVISANAAQYPAIASGILEEGWTLTIRA